MFTMGIGLLPPVGYVDITSELPLLHVVVRNGKPALVPGVISGSVTHTPIPPLPACCACGCMWLGICSTVCTTSHVPPVLPAGCVLSAARKKQSVIRSQLVPGQRCAGWISLIVVSMSPTQYGQTFKGFCAAFMRSTCANCTRLSYGSPPRMNNVVSSF